jgi:gamma-glutamyltranspeptidase
MLRNAIARRLAKPITRQVLALALLILPYATAQAQRTDAVREAAIVWRDKPYSAFEPLSTAQGHKIERDSMVSGLHIIARTNFGGRTGPDSKRRWAGGADPRPEGLAAGE